MRNLKVQINSVHMQTNVVMYASWMQFLTRLFLFCFFTYMELILIGIKRGGWARGFFGRRGGGGLSEWSIAYYIFGQCAHVWDLPYQCSYLHAKCSIKLLFLLILFPLVPDIVVIVKAGSVHVYCNPINYPLLLPYIAYWRNLHIHCLSKEEVSYPNYLYW